MTYQFVKIELDLNQADLYKQFCQHYDNFKVLEQARIFVDGPSVYEVSISPENLVTDVRVTDRLIFKRQKQRI